MRYVPIGSLNAGSVLGQDIHNSVGARLIKKNTCLTEEDIIFIRNLGVPGVYVDDAFSSDILLQEQLRPEIMFEAKKLVTSLFGMAYEEGLTSEEKAIRSMVTEIVESILSDEQVLKNLVDIKTFDDYTYDHSVEVAVLAGVLSARCKYDRRMVERCVTAGFLHDIGKVAISEDIINAPRRLTEEERMLMMQHPQIGYEILTERFNFDDEINIAVYQHHEWYNGNGYPNRITYSDILQISRLIKCADVFDAMTTKRPYHAPYLPSEVMEYIMGRSGMEFDPYVVQVMTSEICVYPIGCEVILSDGRHAIVKENHRGFVLRPTVKIVEDGTVLNLLNDSSTRMLTIVRVLM